MNYATPLVVLALFVSPALGQQTIGFRTDGTGRYPDAQPPLSWGLDKNVIWKVPLTQSNAIPVILGDKIFTCTDPCVLLCINKADGKILWKHESFYKEIVPTDKEKETIEVEKKQDAEFAAQQSALEKQMSALRKMISDGKTTKEETDPKIKQIDKEVNSIRAKRKELTTFNRYKEPGKTTGAYHPVGGYTSATPVTDGKRVYVIYGNGLAAGYDLDGNRLWLKLIEHSTAAYGHGASPVLVKDKLIVHFADLVALDTKDGSEVWRTKINPSHGTSMPTRIGDVDVLIHPGGYAVRISDGKILEKNLGSCGPNSPIIQDGNVYFMAGQARGFTLPSSLEGKVNWEPLWKRKGTNLKGGGYWFPSPILHEGLLYALCASGNFTVVDAKTGERVYEDRLEFGKSRGECYPSLTLAGKYLFVGCDNGHTLILEPGREYKEVAHNSLETFRSSPVFEGKRMYVRTVKNLFCIGEE
jgi:outer membrane protein assembly factor BamB